jgi:methyl-accepting chemotaxis protein
LLAVVVMVGFGALISTQASGTLQEDVQTDLQTLSENRASQLDAWLDTVKRSAVVTSQSEVVTSGDADAIDAELESMVEQDLVPRDVVAVHYVNTDSKVIERSTLDALEGVNAEEQGAPFATDPPSFDGPSDTYVTDPFTVPAVDHPIVAVVTPVAGVEDRMLVFMTDLESRAQSLSGHNHDSATVVAASHSTGRTTSRHRSSWPRTGRSSPTPTRA